ncbi:MAG: hypothetical protein ACYSWX_08470 [Planctomycetota bacterium]|jgi:hypothetical protein
MNPLGALVGGLDRLTSGGLSHFALERALAPYGQLRRLEIDSRATRLEVGLLLHGEERELTVTVGRYRLDRSRSELVLEEVVTDREWATVAVEQFVAGRPLQLPGTLLAALDGVL